MGDSPQLPPMRPMEELPPVEVQRWREGSEGWGEEGDPVREGGFPRWHWGAFAFQWVWAFAHGLFLEGIGLLVAMVVLAIIAGSQFRLVWTLIYALVGNMGMAMCMALVPVWIIPGIRAGRTGYRRAWDTRGTRDFRQVYARERRWSAFGLVFTILVLMPIWLPILSKAVSLLF